MRDGRDIQVVAFRDVTTFGTAVYIKDNQTGKLYTPDGRWVEAIAGAVPPQEAKWTIPDWANAAFLAALNASVGGVESPAQLREDYLAERARVDKFIEMLRPRLVSAADVDREADAAMRRWKR